MSGGTIIMTFGSNKICYSNAYQVIGGKGSGGGVVERWEEV